MLIMESCKDHFEYAISGVSVRFPCKPYPSQLQLMSKIIQALNKGTNALLESPTGSGKSLALLCSSLAWQQSHLSSTHQLHEDNTCCCPCHMAKKLNNSVTDSFNKDGKSHDVTSVQPTTCDAEILELEKTDCDDFQPNVKRFRFTKNSSLLSECASLDESIMDMSETKLPCVSCGCVPNITNHVPSSVSKKYKIFYGTRTHKQISQITHELSRTAYSSVPMVVLASREYTCIHPNVSTSKSKNDDCKMLLDYKEGVSCPYYYKVQHTIGQQAKLKEYGINSSWDIEDLVKLGKKVKACPYYATRSLLDDAEIVFCPYNYLIDTLIRQQISIKLEGSILIFDEGHNMEDAARESASLAVTNRQLRELHEELDKLSLQPESLESYKIVSTYIYNIVEWMDSAAKNLPEKKMNEGFNVWSGEDFLPFFKGMGLSFETYKMIMNHIQCISDDMYSNDQPQQQQQKEKKLKLAVRYLHLLEAVSFVSWFITVYIKKRVALRKTLSMRSQNTLGGWRRRRPTVSAEKLWIHTLYLWCLNPAIAFSELKNAHSIILTSGTLSPMNSFSSELGMHFPIQLEANHIIKEPQTWIFSLSHGPSGRLLNASYQFVETFEFQDEVGEVVLKICQNVPFGVLCFFSSYKLLEKLASRWQNTGMWNEIIKKKHIVCEPRAGEKADFEIAMSQFYQKIKDCTDYSEMNRDEHSFYQDGALFLAVCRGKVSEGLDFSDNNARAVITVGIPFPNIKDEQVELKKEYNDSLYTQRGLLTGSEWYEIQAYRALNQALGRCLRHRHDWGALILIDEHFSKSIRYTKGLSKWIRQRIKHESNFTDAIKSLKAFTQMRVQSLENPTANASLLGTSLASPIAESSIVCTSEMQISSTPAVKSHSNERSHELSSLLLVSNDFPQSLEVDETILFEDTMDCTLIASQSVDAEVDMNNDTEITNVSKYDQARSPLLYLLCQCSASISDKIKDIPSAQNLEVLIASFLQKDFNLGTSTLGVLFSYSCIVFYLPNSFISSCVNQKSVDLLNAVWDSQLGICYSIMECSCGRTVGINIHYVTENNNFLVGKALIMANSVQIMKEEITN